MFLAIGVLLAVAVILWTKRREDRRIEALRRVSRRLGFTFREKPRIEEVLDPADLPLFSRGRRGRIIGALTGSGDETVLEYRYTTGSGNHSHTHRQTVYLYRSSSLRLPVFQLHPEHLGHRLLEALGRGDIDFDSNPEFSRAFVLRGPDEAAIRKVFSRAVMNRLLRRRKLSVEGAGDRLVIYRAGKTDPPEGLRKTLDAHRRLFDLLCRGD